MVVVGENRRARYPLTVDFAPAAFCPASFRHSEVQAVVDDVLPVFCGEDVSQRIQKVVHDHFGHTRRARSEIYEHQIAGVRARVEGKIRRSVFKFFVKVVEVRAVYRQYAFQVFAIGKGKRDMFRNVFFFRRKQQLHARLVHAVRDVFRGEHVSCGDKYDAHFAARHDKYPVFPTTVEHTHYEVAFFHAVRRNDVAHFQRQFFHFAKGDDFFFAFLIAPYKGAFFGTKPCVFVHDVKSEVEIGRNAKFRVSSEIVVVRKIRSIQKLA